jgi:hypothetical protein
MKRLARNRLIVELVSVALIALGFAPTANAGVVSTASYMDSEARGDRIDDITRFLQRSDVRKQLVAFGVSPQRVEARLESLTAAEIAELHGAIGNKVAGGDALGLIGAVFLVLLILELVGVTDVFKAI